MYQFVALVVGVRKNQSLEHAREMMVIYSGITFPIILPFPLGSNPVHLASIKDIPLRNTRHDQHWLVRYERQWNK